MKKTYIDIATSTFINHLDYFGGCFREFWAMQWCLKDYIDPDFKWGNFTIEEQAKVITAARSNTELSPHKMWKDVSAIDG
jgi:hypothetical protein